MKRNILLFGGLFCFIAACLAQSKICSKALKRNDLMLLLNQKRISGLPLGAIQPGCNYNDTVKKRLLYYLNVHWSYGEIDSFIAIKMHESRYALDFFGKTARLNPRNYTEYRHAYDSIYKIEWYNMYQQYRPQFRVSNDLLKNTGYLYIKEAMPILGKALLDNDRYDPYYVKLAMARMGNQIYLEEFLKNCLPGMGISDEDWRNDFDKKFSLLCYLNTQKSIRQAADFIDTARKIEISSHGTEIYAACIVILYLREVILNEEFKAITKLINWGDFGSELTSTDVIIAAKKWLINNEGKYKLSSLLGNSL